MTRLIAAIEGDVRHTPSHSAAAPSRTGSAWRSNRPRHSDAGRKEATMEGWKRQK